MNENRLFVPGRLCLFGEHSDWAGLNRLMNANIVPGMAIVTGLEEGIEAQIGKAKDFIFKYHPKGKESDWKALQVPMNPKVLLKIAKGDSFFRYVAGVAYYLLENFRIDGIKITITKMTLSMKKGLSSSAAICVLVARAFNKLYGLNLSVYGEMDTAFRGELKTNSRCGRLDQACAFGDIPVKLIFDGDEIQAQRLYVKRPLYWVYANLNSHKNTIKILQDLGRSYPFPASIKDMSLHEALGPLNKEIIDRAVDYIEAGNIEELGILMTKAQKLFDEKVAPCSPEELASPKLHQYLNDEMVRELTYGGKGVGSQGDGSIQFLAKDEVCQKKLVEYLNDKGLSASCFTIKPRHRIHKAIIPVAGYGTRMFPYTKAIHKEFTPIISDRVVKPAIFTVLKQVVEAGVDEIYLVVDDEQHRQDYIRFFNESVPNKIYSKLNKKQKESIKAMERIKDNLHFVIQKEKRGLGHAVLLCQDYINNEPVLVMLGDMIYFNQKGYKNCTAQFLDAYDEIQKPIVAIQEVGISNVEKYGILYGTWLDNKFQRLNIRKFIEKPSKAYAKQSLGCTGNDGIQKYYCVAGQYILDANIWKSLEHFVAMQSEAEVGLTEALAKEKELFGVKLNGRAFDMGNPEDYYRTFLEYAGLEEN